MQMRHYYRTGPAPVLMMLAVLGRAEAILANW